LKASIMDAYATFWLMVVLAALGWVAFKHYRDKQAQQARWRLDEAEEKLLAASAANDNGST